MRETPKLCCLLETQPDHDGVKDHDGGVEDHDGGVEDHDGVKDHDGGVEDHDGDVEDHDDHGDEGVDVTKMISMLLNSLDICARCGR